MVRAVVLHTVRRAWDTVATATVTEAEGDAEGAWRRINTEGEY